MRVLMEIPIGVGGVRRSAETGGGTYRWFIHVAPEGTWPHECLVVEACGKQRRQRVGDRAEIEGQ